MYKILYSKLSKADAIEFYLETIKSAIEKAGISYSSVYSLKEIKHDDIVITVNVIDALMVSIFKRSTVINWYQGVLPEESYLRRKSGIRKILCNIFEYISLKYSRFNIFVSHSMKEHYQSKYKYKEDNYFIMPCFCTNINNASFYSPQKYDNAVFAYVGGISKWQCFEKTVRIYKSIEETIGSTKIKILTGQKDEAMYYIKKYNVKNYEINYVKNEGLHNELMDVKYGFLLREESIINHVATPTKMSVYISNGIIPIFSDCIGDFYSVFNNIENKVVFDKCLNDDEIVERIVDFNKKSIDVSKICEEYTNIFNTYYCREKYISQLSGIFLGITSGKQES